LLDAGAYGIRGVKLFAMKMYLITRDVLDSNTSLPLPFIELSLARKKGCNPGLILYEHVISTFHSPVNTPFTINRK
jgi:hypothetical protein